MLYETASRATAVLKLNVEDCDFDNCRTIVTVKGGPRGGLLHRLRTVGDVPGCGGVGVRAVAGSVVVSAGSG